jgi:membrane protease subunit HflK
MAWLRRDYRHAYILVGAMVLVWLGSGFYMVRHGDKGIVFRFGRLRASDVGPGLHYHAPYPMEKVVRLSDRMVQRVEIGFRTSRDSLGTSMEYQWESRHQSGGYVKISEESLVFTGDESIADMNSVVQYRISDPARYLLAVENTAGLVRSVTEAAQRSVVGRLGLEEVLTVDRRDVEVEVRRMVQDLLDRTGAGIEVISVKLQDVHPPMEVVDAFRDVASAREDMHATVNRAQAYNDSIIPETRGQAEEMTTLAKAERAEAVEHATGESKKFLSVLEEYEKSKGITEFRMYLETMERTLPGIRKLLVEPEAGGEPIDLRFFNEQVTPP